MLGTNFKFVLNYKGVGEVLKSKWAEEHVRNTIKRASKVGKLGLGDRDSGIHGGKQEAKTVANVKMGKTRVVGIIASWHYNSIKRAFANMKVK